ncbi:MAG: methylmalonyl-CoA mutase family protein [Bdellovibrionales bacterium]|nr:methylmalonyl-CoA mutase family protein [Bdellovibrionales bacterium]
MAKNRLQNALNKWRKQTLLPVLKKTPLPRDVFRTSSGIEHPDVDLPRDETVAERYLERVGFPGEYPYTRGIYPTMYRGRPWTMRQYAGFGSAKEANARYHYLLAQGVTGLSVAFDLPTQMGRDSDHPLAQSEVGKVGVAIDSLADMERLFDGIPLEQVSVSMTINSTAHILLALYLVLAEKRGIAWKDLRGTIQNDVLKEYIARGTYIYPPAGALRITTDIFEFCSREVPSWNTISISGYHIREAGSTAAQEIAFTLADGIAYVEAARSRGLAVDDFGPRLAFFFNCHNNFLEEVAKFRAARRMWARIMKERFGAEDPRSLMLRFHTQTAGSTLTAQQPLVNVVRTSVQALAAVLGGTQSLHTNSYDEALALPSEEAARLALRTQQVLAAESGVVDVVDPLGGSYTVERLTDELEAKAEDLIEKIDGMGGMVAAIDAGFPQREIEESAYRYQQSLENGDQIVVGINRYRDESDAASRQFELMRIDPAIEAEQKRHLEQLRRERDSVAVKGALQTLELAAKEGANILPSVIDAVRVYATLGEISDVLRQQFGQYRHGS